MGEYQQFDDRYIFVYDPMSKIIALRNRTTRDRSMTFDEAMDAIATILKDYQTKYYSNATDPTLVWMPHAFVTPKVGDILVGTENDSYSIKQLIENPATGTWEGWLKLNTAVVPTSELRHVEDSRLIKFTHESPLEKAGQTPVGERDLPPMLPTVTWTVIDSMPGAFDSRNPLSPAREIKPRLIESYKDSRYPGYTMEVKGQRFDYSVEFDCWSVDHQSAEHLANWFQHFMKVHTWVLQANGVEQVVFQKRTRDVVVTRWRQDIIGRGLRYLIRVQNLETFMRQDLLKLDINLGIANEIETENSRYIADQLVSGQLTPSGYRQLFVDLSGDALFGKIYLQERE